VGETVLFGLCTRRVGLKRVDRAVTIASPQQDSASAARPPQAANLTSGPTHVEGVKEALSIFNCSQGSSTHQSTWRKAVWTLFATAASKAKASAVAGETPKETTQTSEERTRDRDWGVRESRTEPEWGVPNFPGRLGARAEKTLQRE
jgi:hypothetical protein